MDNMCNEHSSCMDKIERNERDISTNETELNNVRTLIYSKIDGMKNLFISILVAAILQLGSTVVGFIIMFVKMKTTGTP